MGNGFLSAADDHHMTPRHEFLLKLLQEFFEDQRLSTAEIEERLEDNFGYRCPDELAKSLARLRRKGLIKGEPDRERGGWIWWMK